MPFDQVGFEVETPVVVDSVWLDKVLLMLQIGRDRIKSPELWCKNKLFLGDARCAVGAIYGSSASGTFDGTFDLDVIREGYAVLRSMLPAGVEVPEFNNLPSTTQADILALFDCAIAARKAEIA